MFKMSIFVEKRRKEKEEKIICIKLVFFKGKDTKVKTKHDF